MSIERSPDLHLDLGWWKDEYGMPWLCYDRLSEFLTIPKKAKSINGLASSKDIKGHTYKLYERNNDFCDIESISLFSVDICDIESISWFSVDIGRGQSMEVWFTRCTRKWIREQILQDRPYFGIEWE
jgi:hypothetical protein